MKLVWSAEAIASLDEVLDYIEFHHPPAAQRFYEYLQEKVNLLQDFPYLGVSLWESAVRKLTLGKYSYSVYYAVVNDEVDLAFVWHDMRLPPAELH